MAVEKDIKKKREMSKSKDLLPYAAIPLIIGTYMVLKHETGDVLLLLRIFSLISFGYVAAYLDFKTRKVPNKLILSMLAVWLVLFVAFVIIDIEAAVDALGQSIISGAAAGGFFLMIYYISRKGVGGGDVKLISVIGLHMTLAKLVPMLFFSSLITAFVSAVLLITKRATMKTAIPLVPFLYLGTLFTIFM